VSEENRYVSTAQVSQALGISVTTVKRWVDDGVLPAHRTAGGHRKLLMADVLRLVRDRNLPHADLHQLLPHSKGDPNDPHEFYQQLVAAMEVIDTDLIRSTVIAGYQSGIRFEVLADRVISPAMIGVGHAWSTGKIDVMHEHRITQAIVTALYELSAILRVNSRKDRLVAVGGAPEHDHYLLPSLLAKLTLIDAGWNAINLGPHTPVSAFRTAIAELSPQLIWLSVSYVDEANQFLIDYRELYRIAEEKGIAVAIGGRAITDELRVQMPYTTYGDGLLQLAAFARTMHRRPQQPRRGRPPGNTSK